MNDNRRITVRMVSEGGMHLRQKVVFKVAAQRESAAYAFDEKAGSAEIPVESSEGVCYSSNPDQAVEEMPSRSRR